MQERFVEKVALVKNTEGQLKELEAFLKESLFSANSIDKCKDNEGRFTQ